ncbi:MAG: tetratricopeptide repeat protein [Gemmatimonadota bacterium]|nr:tetratricopeptide repeat protein [Gemmatimonadota bacterium]
MKNLIHEIHRRSLWQVLGIYLAVSWVVLQVVDVVGNNFGLPDWVAPAALVLLLLGLPVVIATAFVQEGMTAKEFVPPPQSLADAGEVAPSPAPEPETHHRLLTWRNALLGGGAAFVLLAVLTGGYLFMRSSGIGPAGTLVAQGVMDEGASVVLADFDSPDDDLAEVVSSALRVDLLQSPTITVVGETEIAAARERMQVPADAALSGDMARELAVREGYGAVIEGEIGTAGSGYVLTARIRGGADWAPLAAFKSTARSEDDLIDAIEHLSRDIRDKSGESLRSVGNSPALRRVTTASIEALRTYSRAERQETQGDELGAIELYERAIELDPEFAMAYRKLGVVLGNLGIRRADQVAALQRALELRDRLPRSEAYLAEAYHSSSVLGDRAATIRAYESLLEIDPTNIAGLNNLALVYSDMGRFDEAVPLLERAIEVEVFPVAFNNLAWARVALGDDEAGDAVLVLGQQAIPGAAAFLEDYRIELTLERDSLRSAADLLASYEERFPGTRDRQRAAVRRYVLDVRRGRFADAQRRIDDFEGAESASGHSISVASTRSEIVGMLGDTASAVRALVAAVDVVRETRPPAERRYETAVRSLYRLGAVVRADALLDEWKREVPENELGVYGLDDRREMEARRAFGAGDLEAATRLWGAYERECPGVCDRWAAYGLANVHEAAGRPEAAIREFERFLADRGSQPPLLDALYRTPTIERLGYLYDQIGDAENASRYLTMFVDRWDGADPIVQPRVAAARARLAALGGTAQ